MKNNKDIRESMLQANLYYWQIAEKIGVHENTLYRWMRKELKEKEKKKILQAIEDLKNERKNQLLQIS